MADYHGHASTSIPPKSAWGVCDRCGFLFNLSDLKFQYEWRGDALVNTGLRVCHACMDKPFIQNKPLRLTRDPVPVKDPRPNTALIGATIEIQNGIPVPVGGTVVPVDEIPLEEYE